MPKRISLHTTADFTGGLNLVSDPARLQDNETWDLLNVDLNPGGGFTRRDGVRPFSQVNLSELKNIWAYNDGTGDAALLAQQGNNLAYWTVIQDYAANPTILSAAPWGLSLSADAVMHGVTYFDPAPSTTLAVNYIQRWGEQAPIKLTSTFTSTALKDPAAGTPSWNENIVTPLRGNMPFARFITRFREFVFVAGTVENGIAYPNRIRWSHRDQPEDWRLLDSIEVDPGSSEIITGMMPFQNQLLIFKENSVHALTGYDADSFETITLSNNVGAISQAAIAASDEGVYFFSWPKGLYRASSSGIESAFAKLMPLIDNRIIDDDYSDKITVSCIKKRIWVSVPINSAGAWNTETYVFDPLHGGWTRYTFDNINGMVGGLGVGLSIQVNPTKMLYLAARYDTELAAWGAILCHYPSTDILFGDQIWKPDSTFFIKSYYRTSWIDLDNSALKKSWRRPVFVMADSNVEGFTGVPAYDVAFSVYHDYDASQAMRPFSITITSGQEDSLTWGNASEFWDTDLWGYESASGQSLVVKRGIRLGTATAVSLKITGPTDEGYGSSVPPWSISSIIWKYIPKRIRS